MPPVWFLNLFENATLHVCAKFNKNRTSFTAVIVLTVIKRAENSVCHINSHKKYKIIVFSAATYEFPIKGLFKSTDENVSVTIKKNDVCQQYPILKF